MSRASGLRRITAFITAAAAGAALAGCGPQNTTSNGGSDVKQSQAAQTMEVDQTASAYRVWEFAGSAQGFSAGAQDVLETGDAQLRYTAGKEGALSSPRGLSIPAGAVRTVEFRLKTETAETLTLEWEAAGGESADNRVSIPLESDGAFHDYQIDLAGQSGWKDTVSRLKFLVGEGETLEIHSIRLTGLYLVPFPWLSGDYSKDLFRLLEIKESFAAENHTVTVGFSALIQYLDATDEEENLALSGSRTVEYLLKLAKATDMPVMIWLRADPWAEPYAGVAQKLYADDRNLMWTEEIVEKPAYRKNLTGYFNFSLAQTDLEGKETSYWTYTEKLLAQAAREVDAAIQENPGYILGITTTSEYRYLTENQEYILDYNPNTIQEFRNYCKEKYGTLEALNSACGTAFTTWELRSTDYNPVTVENAGGFDAPRERFEPAAFWDAWSDFREGQISTAVQRLVDIIGRELDDKYIYTHQIAYDDHTTASPITTGNAAGSNIGIDFFNHEVTEGNMQAITDMLAGDVSRTWGCPEWLVTHAAPYESTQQALEKMAAAGVKYLCPFNWGSGDEFDVQGSPAEEAIADYVASLERLANPLMGVSVTASSGFSGAQSLLDGNLTDGFTAESFKAGDWICFDFGAPRSVSSLTLIPPQKNGALPLQVTVQADTGSGMQTVGVYSLEGLDPLKPVNLYFQEISPSKIKLIVDQPAVDDSGALIFSLTEIQAGLRAESVG